MSNVPARTGNAVRPTSDRAVLEDLQERHGVPRLRDVDRDAGVIGAEPAQDRRQQPGPDTLDGGHRDLAQLPDSRAARSARVAPIRASTCSAWSSSSRPASVSSTGRRPPGGRCRTAVPTIRSRPWICWLTPDCVYPSARAAAPNEPSLATSVKARRWRA